MQAFITLAQKSGQLRGSQHFPRAIKSNIAIAVFKTFTYPFAFLTAFCFWTGLRRSITQLRNLHFTRILQQRQIMLTGFPPPRGFHPANADYAGALHWIPAPIKK